MSVVSRLRQGGGLTIDVTATIENAAARIGCETAVLHAILDVESGGDAFDDQGRLIILPEKHIFHRKLPKGLRAKARAMGLAATKWTRANYRGLGGKGSDARWDRLSRMARLHEGAALLSASYGSAQIMGFNHKLCGFSTVTEFVLALAQSNEAHVEAFVAFLEHSGLFDELRARDFRGIARRYNGSGQVSKYAAMMERAYRKRSAGGEKTPPRKKTQQSRNGSLRLGSEGFRVKALQSRLNELNYAVKADGDFGPATRRAVVAFQVDHSLKPDGLVGVRTEAALDVAVPINQQLGGGREQLTVKDLRKSGSQTVKKADWLTRLGGTIFGTGTVASALDGAETGGMFDSFGQITDSIQTVRLQLQPLFDLIANNKWLAFILLGVAVVFIAHQIKQRRLEDAQNWRHVG